MSVDENREAALRECRVEIRAIIADVKDVQLVRAHEQQDECGRLRCALEKQRGKLAAQRRALELDSRLDVDLFALINAADSRAGSYNPLDPSADSPHQMVQRKRDQTARLLAQLEKWMSAKIDQLGVIADAQEEQVERLKAIGQCEKRMSDRFRQWRRRQREDPTDV